MNKQPFFRITLVVILQLLFSTMYAQDFMRSTGKINVVFGVVLIIFIGIIIFLLFLERRIKQIEKRINNE